MLETKYILLIAIGTLALLGTGFGVYFTLTTPTFDPNLAVDIDYYSKVSYCDVSAIQSWTCGASCNYHSGMKEV